MEKNQNELGMFETSINEAIKVARSNIEWIDRSADEINQYFNPKPECDIIVM